jgi:hypothetical protein
MINIFDSGTLYMIPADGTGIPLWVPISFLDPRIIRQSNILRYG